MTLEKVAVNTTMHFTETLNIYVIHILCNNKFIVFFIFYSLQIGIKHEYSFCYCIHTIYAFMIQ
jgi:hypothetical protein